MDFLFSIGIYIVPTILFIVLGAGFGSWAEHRHFKSLNAREARMSPFVVTNSKLFYGPIYPAGAPTAPTIVCAETVVASDYFKNFVSQFRKFFGGEMRSYNSLMDRARRETLMRLREQANQSGYNAICNVRLEPVSLGGFQKKASVMVCILGTATAYTSQMSQAATQQPAAQAVSLPPMPPIKPTA